MQNLVKSYLPVFEKIILKYSKVIHQLLDHGITCGRRTYINMTYYLIIITDMKLMNGIKCIFDIFTSKLITIRFTK